MIIGSLRPAVFDGQYSGEIDGAFRNFVQQKGNALLIGTDTFFLVRRQQIIALTAYLAIPAMYNAREYVVAGGLMSYAPSFGDVYRQAGVYAAKILEGANPADLPVMQPTKFELAINLRSAKALGLDIPDMLLATADEVDPIRGAVCCGAYVASWHDSDQPITAGNVRSLG